MKNNREPKRSKGLRNKVTLLLVFLVPVFLAGNFCGCKSTIGPAIEEAKKQAEVRELNLDEMFSEANGFHFPGYNWGDEFAQFQKAADYPITGIAGYSEDGTYYDCAKWHVKLGELENDGATVATDEEERVQLVMFEFADSARPVTTEIFKSFAEEIGRHFDVQPELKERNEATDEGSYRYVTYYWRYTLPDGKETSLQWAAAYVQGVTNPMAATFSLSYIAPEEKRNETE